MRRGQAERLFPLIREVLDEVGIPLAALCAVGVGVGPGVFTGTRIAVAAAKGLAFSLGVPAIGVTRFEALRLGHKGAVLASVAAGHQGLFLQANDGSSPCALRLEQLKALPDGCRAVVGDQSTDIASKFGIARLEPRWPLPAAIAMIASARTAQSETPPVPLYVRPADAVQLAMQTAAGRD